MSAEPPARTPPEQRSPRRRRLLLAVIAGVVIAITATALALAGHRRSADTSGRAAGATEPALQLGSGPGAPTLDDVRALLAGRATALLARDRSSFLSDIDQAGPATAFRVRQQQLFDDLAQVPLGSWSYQVEAPVTGADETAAAARRYGAPTLLARVQLSYTLRDADPVAATHDQWLSFVRRDGRVLLAGDDDLANNGGASWQGLWDFGPVIVHRGAHSLVLAHPANADALDTVASLVDRAVPAVTEVWGSNWAQYAVVLIPDSTQELDAMLGQQLDLSRIEALSVTESEPDLSNDTPRLVQRVVMNPAKLRMLSDVGRRIVVQHEVTHIATRPVTGQATPTWLVEGFAEYVGNLDSGQPVTVAAAELAGEIRANRTPTALPAGTQFAGSSTTAAQAYEEAWLACRLIAERSGTDGLVRLYREVGTAQSGPDQALAGALQDVLHESVDQFTAQWRTYLTQQLA